MWLGSIPSRAAVPVYQVEHSGHRGCQGFVSIVKQRQGRGRRKDLLRYPHRAVSQLPRDIAGTITQRGGDLAVPAGVEGAFRAHRGDHECDMAGVIEHRGGEGVDAGQGIADRAREPVAADLVEHLRSLRVDELTLRIVADTESVEAALERRPDRVRRHEGGEGAAGCGLQQRHHRADAHRDMHGMARLLEPHHGGAMGAPDRQRHRMIDAVGERGDPGRRDPHR